VEETTVTGDAFSVRPGRILLVDDDPSVRLATRNVLEELGHEVVEAAGGAEALDVLAGDRRFDLLLLDFAMPLMNGSQLATEVRRIWSEAPILFVTGYVENDALRPRSELGYGTVRKPFSARDLATAVGHTMRHVEATVVWSCHDALMLLALSAPALLTPFR
jgi:CheY-like chemotaxis protein